MESTFSPELQAVVDEFTDRLNRGERPVPDEYVRRHPEHAAELREVLGMLAALSPLRSLDTHTNPDPAGTPAGDPVPHVPGFEILDELGRGGMGVVYKARQVALNRVVALKLILAGAHASAAARARFAAEAATLAGLDHPHVVKVFDFGSHEGNPYFALEYVPGGTLAERLAAGPLAPGAAAALVEQLARAIAHTHAAGIVHRDLKPANVLLSAAIRPPSLVETPRDAISTLSPEDARPGASDGPAPKITDFGLARDLSGESGLTATGAILGTPSYMAPEQAARGRAGPAVDVYALGAILYECLTGRPPFRGATVLDTLEQVKSCDPVPVRELQPGVPRDLETVCLKCLEKVPEGRYRSALALAADLSNFLAGQPITARPVGLAERAWRWCRRNPAAAALLLLMVAATVGSVAAASLFRASQKRAERAESGERVKRLEASENLTRAVAAEIDAEGRLWRSHRDEAAAARYSGRQGQRFRSLELLKQAAETARRRGESAAEIARLRDEAAACLCLPDVRTVREWQADADAAGDGDAAVDRNLTVYARSTADGRVRVRKTSDNSEVAVFAVPGLRLEPLAFFPDGSRLITLSVTSLAGFAPTALAMCWDVGERRRLWSTQTHTQPWPFLTLHDPRVAASPDGRTVAVARPGGTLALLDADTGRSVGELVLPTRVTASAFSPDGRRVAVWASSDPNTSAVHIAEVSPPRFVSSLAVGRVNDVRWTREGDGLLVAPNDGQYVQMWPFVGRRAYSAGRRGSGNLQFSPIEAEPFFLSKTLRRTGWLWRADPAGMVMQVPPPVSGLRPDGRAYLSLDRDTFRLVEVNPAVERRQWGGDRGPGGTIGHVDFSPDGRVLVIRRSAATRFHDMVDGLALGHAGTALSGAFARNGEVFLAGVPDRGLVRWTVSRDGGAVRLRSPEVVAPFTTTFANWHAAVDAAGRVVVVADDRGVVAHDLGTGERKALLPPGWRGTVALSGDGRWAAAAGTSASGVVVFDPATGRRVHEVPTPLCRAQFTRDGRHLIVNSQAEIRYFAVGTWEPVRTIPRETDIEDAGLIAESPDGRLTAAHLKPEEVQLLDPSGRVVVSLDARDDTPPRGLVFSPDGGRLVAVHAANIWVYDLRLIRAGLRAMNLDWDGPELPPESPLAPVTKLEIEPLPPLPVAPRPRAVPKKK